jgi:hypothetical protein
MSDTEDVEFYEGEVGAYDDDEGETASDDGVVEVSPAEEDRLYHEMLKGLKEAGF